MTPTIETFRSNRESVPIEIFTPATGGAAPAVLIIHGSAGLGADYRDDIASFAGALVEKGIAATLPHYFVAAKMTAEADGLPLIGVHFDTWKQACSDALAFMARDPRFDAARLGVIGFSLGAHYALTLAMDPPAGTAVACVVDFFGPTLSPALDGRWANMPPLLIHHGDADTLVRPQHSEHLMSKLEEAGKKKGTDFRLETYAGQGHRFDDVALKKSRELTTDFIKHAL